MSYTNTRNIILKQESSKMYQEKIQIEQNVAMPPRRVAAKDSYGVLDTMSNGESFFISMNSRNKKDTVAYRQGLLAYAVKAGHIIATRTLDGGYRVWMVKSATMKAIAS